MYSGLGEFPATPRVFLRIAILYNAFGLTAFIDSCVWDIQITY